MVIGNLTRRERVLDILANIHDVTEIEDKDERIQQLESIAESIGELNENRKALQDSVLNLANEWRMNTDMKRRKMYDDIINLFWYIEQSLMSKTIG
jgi:hypothetical protein